MARKYGQEIRCNQWLDVWRRKLGEPAHDVGDANRERPSHQTSALQAAIADGMANNGAIAANDGKDEWKVSIIADDPIDEDALTSKVEAARRSLVESERRLHAAKQYEHIARFENEKFQVSETIARLEMELSYAKIQRRVSGLTAGGDEVKLVATSLATAKLAAKMQAGSTYKVTGLAIYSDGIYYIHMTEFSDRA